MAGRRARAMDPDQLAELEEQRRYLLQSLRDLDREYEAGDVDEHDYVTLRDDYTSRAAHVLRQIEEGRAALPPRQPRHWGKTIAATLVVVGVAVGVGVAVAQSSGQRMPGEEITGRGAAGEVDPTEALTEARRLMSTEPRAAAELYRMVLEYEPEHVEALTYYGWLTAAIGGGSTDDELRAEAIAEAKGVLDQASELDPSYADPHCLGAVISAVFEEDPDAALPQAETCLDLNPPAELRGLVLESVDGLAD